MKLTYSKLIDFDLEVSNPFYFVMLKRGSDDYSCIYRLDDKYWTFLRRVEDNLMIEKLKKLELKACIIDKIDMQQSLDEQDKLRKIFETAIKEI